MSPPVGFGVTGSTVIRGSSVDVVLFEGECYRLNDFLSL
jgi:hypothetical protein